MSQFVLYQLITTVLTFMLSAVTISRTIVLTEIFGFREVEFFTIFSDKPILPKKQADRHHFVMASVGWFRGEA